MAQDNREFLKLCSYVNDLLHKDDLRDLYKVILKRNGRVESIWEFNPNCFKVKVNYWELAQPNGQNISSYLTTKDFILKPRKENG